MDPAPLPPHGAIPELNITDWRALKLFSQRERELILKISGYSEKAWGARGVHLGSDLSSRRMGRGGGRGPGRILPHTLHLATLPQTARCAVLLVRLRTQGNWFQCLPGGRGFAPTIFCMGKETRPGLCSAESWRPSARRTKRSSTAMSEAVLARFLFGMTLTAYTALAASSLFVILDPISVVA